jgi:hypothetical protein
LLDKVFSRRHCFSLSPEEEFPSSEFVGSA